MIRVAALGDPHAGRDTARHLCPLLADLRERADLLLVAGDLTRHGDPEEAAVFAEEVRDLGVPVIAVLGNHDHHGDQEDLVRKVVGEAGVIVLEGESTVVEVGGDRVGVAGAKGFGVGFPGACATEFGEPEVKAFVRHSRETAARLGRRWPSSTPTAASSFSTSRLLPRRWSGSGSRSTRSWAAISWPTPSTAPVPTSSCTAMPTPAARRAPRRRVSRCETSPSR